MRGALITSVTDPLHHLVLSNSYDGDNRVAGQTDAAGGALVYAYDGISATQVHDQNNSPRTYYHDAALRITAFTDAYGNSTTIQYDADNNPTQVSQPLGGGAAYTWDVNGNRLSKTDAENETWRYSYDSFNDLLSATDSLGHGGSNGYDVRGNRISMRDAGGNSTLFTVNTAGKTIGVQDPRGNSIGFGYNSFGDVTSVSTVAGTTTSVYDSAGRPLAVTDPLGHQSSTSYDAAGNALSATDALGHSTTASFDADGHKVGQTDPLGHTNGWSYDASGLLTRVIDAAGGTISYGYDRAGNRIRVTDAADHATTYAFDADNRPTTVVDPAGRTTQSLAYDAAGRVATKRDGKSQLSSFAYTPRGELSSAQYADGSTVSYQYDALGNRLQLGDATGLTNYSYDALSHPTAISFPGNRTVQYSYDGDGNRTAISYPGGSRQVNYAYDQLNRLSTVTDWNNAVTQYAYDAAGRLTGTTLPAATGVSSAYQYDDANRLLSVRHSKGANTLASASYTLDAAGTRTAKTTSAGTESYSYDALTRLTGATIPSGGSIAYSYDATGNRLSLVDSSGSTSYSYDAASQLTTLQPPGAAAVVYSYDGNGSQTAKGSETFSWNAVNQLTASTAGNLTASMSYNGDGLRQSRTVSGVTTNFVWDVAGKLPVVLDDGSQYVYGAGLVSRTGSGGTVYYLADGLGSTMALVDASGTVVQTYDYDPFGSARTRTGTQGTEFQFAGQQTDPSGLQYLRARYYDPSTGRFLSRDPDGHALADPATHQPYAYAADDPALASDPSGLGLCIPSPPLNGGLGGCGQGSPFGAIGTGYGVGGAIFVGAYLVLQFGGQAVSFVVTEIEQLADGYILHAKNDRITVGDRKLTNSSRRIADKIKRDIRDVLKAVHKVKNKGKYGGAKNYNKDVWIDEESLDVYVEDDNGRPAEDIGNLNDYLPDQPDD